MDKIITCSVCGALINYYNGECVDINDYDTYLEKKVVGTCNVCHSDVVWYEVYTFNRISKIYKI